MDPIITPDGRYLVVRGRLWRAANPQLAPEERVALTAALMDARRAVGTALRNGDLEAQRAARRGVDRAKVALGERGQVWWTDGTPDLNRRLIRNTPYRDWYEQAVRWDEAILAMLDERAPESSICPSEVARRVAPDGWRTHMDDAREAARRLARQGAVRITQRGKTLDPDGPFRGPVRIYRSR